MREMNKLLHKWETTAIGKSFIVKIKKYFSANQYLSKFEKMSILNLCDGAKEIIYPKKQEKDCQQRYSTNFRSSRPEMFYKKGKEIKNSQANSTGAGRSVCL